MNLFSQILAKLRGNGDRTDFSGAVPGAMGRLLASMGIHELGPVQRGIPGSVLMGNREELVLIPGATRPAYTKEGKPVLIKTKQGRTIQATENFAVTRKQWKQMINDQKRKAEGRWYSGKKAA
ncbi:hypothetical protein Pan1_61 [Pseudanabaena phage Pan1]|nr:hypothetical protein Pan1_61 [Pseudanabaena phage Pan1]